jgi:protein TonB
MTGWRFQPATDAGGRPQATLSLARFTFSAATADTPSAVTVRLAALPQVTPPPLEAGQLVGLADAKQPGYSPPRPLRNITPRYTEDAMRAKVQGPVTMELIVLADGTVGAARVTSPLHDSLDRAALVAAKYWYFDPARVNGQVVPTKVRLELAFNLR